MPNVTLFWNPVKKTESFKAESPSFAKNHEA